MNAAVAARPCFIVLNAGSGRQAADATADQIHTLLTDAGRPHQLLLAEQGRDIPRLAREAVARAQAADGIVVAAGGDGTINAVAQAALGCGQPFAVLPQGTFNYFGRAHGIPQDTAEAVAALLAASPQPVQVGLVNDRVFLVNASLGLYPQLLEDREAFKARFGRSRLVAMVSGLLSFLRERRQLHVEIEIEGETRTLRTPTLFVGNNALQLTQIGIADAEALGRGRLVAIGLKPVGSLAMLGLLLRGALGRLGDADQVVSFPLRSLTIRPPGGHRSRRYKVAMDGEVTRLPSPLVFRIAPEPLLLMVPPATASDGAATAP
ncbi:MAG: diacylglycerol/lipid kinase family protein [Nevskia sp.]|uniref:diacylglycerol/lipid kinase family protein n=1 Tax=Nevskia sp. TaxID=1929292 RepID=UPI004035FFD2